MNYQGADFIPVPNITANLTERMLSGVNAGADVV